MQKRNLQKHEWQHSNTAGLQGFVMNTRRKPLDDIRVRRALVLSFDYESINNRLFYGLYKRSYSLFTNGSMAAEGKPFANRTLPQLCQTCQWPMLFTEPDDPTKICYRESDYQGEKYHTCSDGCKHIFDDEPEKYIQAWLPVHQIYQGNCFPEGTDPTVEGFDPLAAVIKYYNLEHGRDNLDFEGSEDQKNFEAWHGQATKNV